MQISNTEHNKAVHDKLFDKFDKRAKKIQQERLANTERKTKCDVCGNDQFTIEKNYSGSGITKLGKILLGILFICVICKDEEYLSLIGEDGT